MADVMQKSPNKNSLACFIERITVVSWLFHIFPYIFKEGLEAKSLIKRVYFIDATKPGFLLAKITSSIINIRLRRLNFRCNDIKDEAGVLMRLKIAYFDFVQLRKDILKSSLFQCLDSLKDCETALGVFLKKQIAAGGHYPNTSIQRAQMLVQIAAWGMKKEEDLLLSSCILFLSKRMWIGEIKEYASRYNVHVIPVRTGNIKFKNTLINICGRKLKILQSVYFNIKRGGSLALRKRKDKRGKTDANTKSLEGVEPKLMVQYFGHFNLDRPDLYSDLFFWQQSQFPAENILIMFNNSMIPLDEDKWRQIEKYKMSAIAVSPNSTILPKAPIFYHRVYKADCNIIKAVSNNSGTRLERKWLKRQLDYYFSHYNYWADFFKRYNIKIYLSWYKYDSYHCIISDAIRSVGGINVVYQRAYEGLPSIETTVDCDIVFGFSSVNAEIEHLSGSCIRHHVSVGYFGDHRFPLVKKQAYQIRSDFEKNGTKHILTYFDENSNDDFRWGTGHDYMRTSYEFLLEKVLLEPWFGLIVKPKVPSTLRRRLGPVADLLKEAEATGRCFVFEAGALHGSNTPAAAALASDVAVHGHLYAATAGVEAALAGVPTLLLDRESWSLSPLYKLDKGKVIFDNWQDLWKTCKVHWNSPTGVSGFGDWSSILDEIDPFRDGRAAERIGTYLKWLSEGFKGGLSRETVLADATQQYTQRWGRDKVVRIG